MRKHPMTNVFNLLQENTIEKHRPSQFLLATALTFNLMATIFFFIPIVLYTGNIDEFVVSLPTTLGYYIRPALFLIAFSGLISMFLSLSVFRTYIALLAVGGILLWLQGNLLVWDYGLLDGRTIDWSKGAWRGWLDIGIWILCISVALAFHRRIGKLLVYLAIASFFLQLTGTVSTFLQAKQKLLDKTDFQPAGNAANEVHRFSSDKNVVQLIMDGFQSDLFEEIVNTGEEGKQFREALDGFVFFKENLGVFPYTHMSVPAILSGKVYQNNIASHLFIEQALTGDTIASAAQKAGYEIDLITPGGLLYNTYSKIPHKNAYIVPAKNHVTLKDYEHMDVARLTDLALFRIAPHFVKKYIYNNQQWVFQSMLNRSSEYTNLQFFAHKAVLSQFAEKMKADRASPVYKLFHLMLVHNPMVVNTNCDYAGKLLPTVKANALVQAKCSLAEAVRLLNKMKELGIYDNALIVLMADHGVWIPPSGLKPAVDSNGQKKFMNPIIVAQALPLMAIKQPGTKGPLKTSTVPGSIVDTSATIASILGFDEKFSGSSLFDIPPEKQRPRRYYFYEYSRGEWEADYLNPLQEFIVTGSVMETKDWKLGRRLLPGGKIETNQALAEKLK